MSTHLDPEELEALIRRVVREELRALLRPPDRSVAADSSHEGPADPAGDELALRGALRVLGEHGDRPEAWRSWEEFEAELERAEAAGELPD